MGRIRGTSVAGAQGPMQFLPTTWARWGRGDIQDPADAIMAAARYLAHNGFARGREAWTTRCSAYNNSDPTYVRGVTALREGHGTTAAGVPGYYHWDIYYLTAARRRRSCPSATTATGRCRSALAGRAPAARRGAWPRQVTGSCT